MPHLDNNIIVLDTTLRDGEQTPGVNLNTAEKVEIAKYLEALGVNIIEAGFPAASPADADAVKAVALNANCSVAALCRCIPSDIYAAWDVLKFAAHPRLHLFIATSPIHMSYKLKLSPEQVFAQALNAISIARTLCDDVQFSCEDASRSSPDFLFQLLSAAIDAGASTVNIPDTVGYALPSEFGLLIASILDNVPNISRATLGVHCHNDLGLAVANTLSALQYGARHIETTINGLGERAGNCPLDEVIMALNTRSHFFNLSSSIRSHRFFRTSQRVSKLSGIPVHLSKPIVGANAFTHESGIHQHGVLENPMTYEIMSPQSVGFSQNSIVLGKLSGRHALAQRLSDLGFDLSNNSLDTAFLRFKELAAKKKLVTDDDLSAIADSLLSVPESFKLISFNIRCASDLPAVATISLDSNGASSSASASGDGPIDAAFNATTSIVGGAWSLASYHISSVGEGMDALGEVTVRVRINDQLFVGRGLSTDIIEASILAYINAINRAIFLRPHLL